MWVHLEDESQHQYTKDVDFAILLNDCNKLEKVVSKKGIPFKYLQIGGIGIREEFVELLEESSETWNIRVAAYCLMPNHYHILVQTPDANISRSMRHINGVYTQRFNKRHRYDDSSFVADTSQFLLAVTAIFCNLSDTYTAIL